MLKDRPHAKRKKAYFRQSGFRCWEGEESGEAGTQGRGGTLRWGLSMGAGRRGGIKYFRRTTVGRLTNSG